MRKFITLIADDESPILELVSTILENEDYTVLKAESASTAERVLDLFPEIDIVLTDLSMTEADEGFKVAAYSKHQRPHRPVILISSHANELIPQMEEAGIDDILRKPYTPQELREKVNGWRNEIAHRETS